MQSVPPSHDIQTWMAIGVVIATIVLMIVRTVSRARKKSGGCGSCGSDDCHPRE